ncbi:peptide ABC transporter substrate-binding protein, partial [Clostridium cochlearium]|uniref:peptide ABC transporter substrate-binding protein n=1 Tax=Clostridium cochlearium TaxID=1494 RepID=UPI00181A41AF
MKNKNIFILILALTLLLNLTGCNNEAEPNVKQTVLEIEEDKEITYEPEYGGSLVLPLTPLNTLNPLLSENLFYYHFNKLIFEGLFELDNNLDVIPVLAKDYSIREDGKVINIRLKENVKWHDGEKFDAEDVAFTINTIKFASEDTVYKKMLNDTFGSFSPANINRIINVEIIDPYELNIVFDRSFSHGLETLTFPIIPKHKFTTDMENKKSYIAALSEEDYTPIGTGPYKFKNYEKYKTITLSFFNEYREGRPYIDEIKGKVLEDEELILTAFETGQVDLTIPVALDWEKYDQKNRIRIYEFISQNYEFLGFNFSNKILGGENGKYIRKAFAYGIDRQGIIQSVYLGHGTQANVPIHPNSWLLWEGANIYGYNPTKAREELEKIGWKDVNGDGFYEDENGKEIVFRLLTNSSNSLRLKTADMVVENLNKIGIKVVKDYPEAVPDNLTDEILDEKWEELNQKLLKGDFDLVVLGWHLSSVPELSFAFHSNQIKSGTNFIGYKDEKMDEMLMEVFSA